MCTNLSVSLRAAPGSRFLPWQGDESSAQCGLSYKGRDQTCQASVARMGQCRETRELRFCPTSSWGSSHSQQPCNNEDWFNDHQRKLILRIRIRAKRTGWQRQGTSGSYPDSGLFLSAFCTNAILIRKNKETALDYPNYIYQDAETGEAMLLRSSTSMLLPSQQKASSLLLLSK